MLGVRAGVQQRCTGAIHCKQISTVGEHNGNWSKVDISAYADMSLHDISANADMHR